MRPSLIEFSRYTSIFSHFLPSLLLFEVGGCSCGCRCTDTDRRWSRHQRVHALKPPLRLIRKPLCELQLMAALAPSKFPTTKKK
jgi:hypothetical protein